MDIYEDSRRRFLGKLGLTLGTAILTSNGITAQISQQPDLIILPPEQQKFMNEHERWLDGFAEVIRRQKENNEDMENNHRLMALTDEFKGWQKQLTEYMKDENFAKYYMIMTQRITNEI